MFASYLRSIPILWSKRRGLTILQTKIILANSWKWWFFAFYTHFYHNFIENSSKVEFYQTVLMTLTAAKKFSVTFWHALCVFFGDVLGPYLSAEANGVVRWCFNRNILSQTATYGDFSYFYVIQSVILRVQNLWKSHFLPCFLKFKSP